MVDADELSRLLAGTALGARPVLASADDVLAVRCTDDEVWPAWQAARSVLDASGRCPVVITSWDDRASSAWPADDPGYTADRVAEVLAAVGTVDPWTTFTGGYRATDQVSLDDVRWWVDDVVLPTDEVHAAVARGLTWDGFERWRLDRRVASASTTPQLIPVSEWFTDREKLWFTPTDQPCAVLFLPTPRTWESAAYVSYYGALEPHQQAALAAVERRWHQRFGAELVAAWGTMLQFVAHRRPVTVEQAWELSGEQLAVGGSLQLDRSDLALALMQTDHWFLHDRP